MLVGPLEGGAKRRKADLLARRHLKANNIFPDLWEDAVQYLSPAKSELLRYLNPLQVQYESAIWCKRWWQECGKKVPKGTTVRELRAQVIEWHRYLSDNPGAKLAISKGHTHTH